MSSKHEMSDRLTAIFEQAVSDGMDHIFYRAGQPVVVLLSHDRYRALKAGTAASEPTEVRTHRP